MKIKKSQHESFTKFFEKPTRKSLKELIEYNLGETDLLDFKKEWPNDVKVSKHVLALANSGGGCLVIGLEEVDGSIQSVGLEKIKDKTVISSFLNKYVPQTIEYEILDFTYDDSEYSAIKGKKFQVLIVEYPQASIPVLSLKDGNGIKRNAAYIRKGVQTNEANHEDFQKLITNRIETEYSSIPLAEHFEHLYTLYDYTWPDDEIFEYHQYLSYNDFEIPHPGTGKGYFNPKWTFMSLLRL